MRQKAMKKKQFKKKLYIGEQSRGRVVSEEVNKYQYIKLQKYTMTPFERDYKD